MLCGCLGACYCQTRTACPAKLTSSPTPETPIIQPDHTQQQVSPQQTVLSKETSPIKAGTTLPTAQKPIPNSNEPVLPVAPVVNDLPLPTNDVVAAETETAQQLIAQARANQTLAAPPTDTPSFKKEELLPTNGRLLNPLAYEPLLPDTTHAPWSNESLKYGVYYSFVKAGTAYIKTRGLVSKNGKTAYLIQTTAFSASVIDAVFKVRDINYSWLDVDSLHSVGYSQSLREGNYKRDEWVIFDNRNNLFYGQVQKKEEAQTLSGELKQEVLDILTSLYFVRAQTLEVGKDITFDIINREQQYPLVVKVLGKETVKTPAGKFNCWVVEPQFRGEGIFVTKGKSLKVWLSDDRYRMPVKMAVEVFIGSVTAELLDYTRN